MPHVAIMSDRSAHYTFAAAWTLLHVRMMQTSLLHCVLFVALAGGCTGSGQFAYTGQATTPDLIVIRPGVQVITGLDEPIFYNGNYYWRNEGGFWYRSIFHTGGWVRVEDAPVEIRTIDRPSLYIRYHGEARAGVSGEHQAHVPPGLAS
jgi:hypothetical protein